MSDDDDYPPEARPEWLQPYAHIKGTLSSAPLDMPARLDSVVAALKAAGWSVVVRSVGTDFSGPLGIPVPRDQPLDILLDRQDQAYTADDAQNALSDALSKVNVNYSPIGAWTHELNTQVVQPSLQDAATAAKKAVSATPYILAGVVGLAVLILVIKLKS